MQIEGWRHVETGGGCTALRRDLEGGTYALLTDGNQTAPTTDGDLVLGLYTRSDLYVGTADGNLATCLAWLDSITKAAVRCVDLNQDTREPIASEFASWSGSLLDLIDGNADDEETCEKACALAIGESVEVGGGAGVLTRIERLFDNDPDVDPNEDDTHGWVRS